MRYLLFFMLISCTDYIGTWDGYEIKQGQHFSRRSGLPPRLVSLKDGSKLEFKAKFTSSCLYTSSNNDLNKLYGFADCNSTVHHNSARFAWRHNQRGQIEIFAYWYDGGLRGFKKLGETVPYREDSYSILAGEDYSFCFNGVEFKAPRSKKCNRGIRIRLFPYFGGNYPAPNDILIMIYELQ